MTKLILITGLLLVSTVAMSAPTKYCNPEKSKPCGNACISLTKQCRTPWTTAVSGIRPASEKGKSFSSPKYVEKAPVKGKQVETLLGASVGQSNADETKQINKKGFYEQSINYCKGTMV